MNIIDFTNMDTSVREKFINDFQPDHLMMNFFNNILTDLLQRSVDELLSSSKFNTGIYHRYKKDLNQLLRQQPNCKEIAKSSKRALHGIFVLTTMSLLPWNHNLLIQNHYELMEKYRSFQACPQDELNKLLNFRNFLVISLQFKPAKMNKDFHMDICVRLCEGYNRKYITGSGQSEATQRRVDIINCEGGLKRNHHDFSTSSGSVDSVDLLFELKYEEEFY